MSDPTEREGATTEEASTPQAPARSSPWSALRRSPRPAALGAGVVLVVAAAGVAALVLSRHHAPAAPAPARYARGGHAFGPGGPGLLRVDALAVAARAIGISPDDLRRELASGRSIAEVAHDHNVDRQKVIDAIARAERTLIEDAVRAGYLGRTTADRIEQSLAGRAALFVDAPGGLTFGSRRPPFWRGARPLHRGFRF